MNSNPTRCGCSLGRNKRPFLPNRRPDRRSSSACRAPYRLAAALGALILFAAACATPGDKAFNTEKLLVAAGFTYKEVQTPEQLEKLKKLPQNKLIRHERQGKIVYLYADAAGCQCLWAGDEKANERFFKLHREARLNTSMHKRDWNQGDLWSTGEDATSYVDDIDSGMIPGY